MLTIFGHGRIAADIDVRETQAGTKVANVRVACDRRDRKAEPVYMTLVLWEGAADNAAKHLVKGQAVTFTGRLEPRSYDKDGHTRTALEVHGVELEYGAKPRNGRDG